MPLVAGPAAVAHWQVLPLSGAAAIPKVGTSYVTNILCDIKPLLCKIELWLCVTCYTIHYNIGYNRQNLTH